MHHGADDCIECIIGDPVRGVPAGAAAAGNALGLRVIGYVRHVTW
jgi:hypothetical protein